MEHHHQQIVTICKQEMSNLLGFFNDIHVFLFYFAYLPALPFHLHGPPEQQQINLAWQKPCKLTYACRIKLCS